MGRLGTRADILMTEAFLGKMVDVMESMLLDAPVAGIVLSGERIIDENGDYVEVTSVSEEGPVGVCIGSQEGGTELSDNDLAVFKKTMADGILIKVDVYAHQISSYKIGDEVSDATIIFRE